MLRHMRYHRNKDRQARGLIILDADLTTGVVTIGWSLCAKEDDFNKTKARHIADGRIKAGKIKYNFKDYNPNFIKSLIYSDQNQMEKTSSIPHSMRNTLYNIVADVNNHCLKIQERNNVATGR